MRFEELSGVKVLYLFVKADDFAVPLQDLSGTMISRQIDAIGL